MKIWIYLKPIITAIILVPICIHAVKLLRSDEDISYPELIKLVVMFALEICVGVFVVSI